MAVIRSVFLKSCIVVCTAAVVDLFMVTPARAQDPYTFDWRAVGIVRRATEGADRHSTTTYQRTGTSTLTLVRDPAPDIRFALDFSGPDGAGSGFVPRRLEETVDPNFTYPSPLPPGLPAAQARRVRGTFRRLVDGPLPPTFQIVLIEEFVCRRALVACGGVSSWEVTFIGTARSVSRPTR